MKAAFKTADGHVKVKDIGLRDIQPDEIKVKVEACGICGTDILENGGGNEEDRQFGHEVAGVILETGSAVYGLSRGQRIALDSATPCGTCVSCRNASQELCQNLKSFFCIPSFGLAEEMIAPAASAIPYSGLRPEEACLQEPLGVAIDVFRLSETNLTSNVLVMGQGPIGLMVLSLVKRSVAGKVFVSDYEKRTGRYNAAMKIGVDGWIDPMKCLLEEYDFGCRIDRIIVTSPPPTLKTAFNVASPGAIISFIGIGGRDKGEIAFDADAFHYKKLQLRASFASPALYGPMALGFLREKVVAPEILISHCFELDDISTAMDTAAKDLSAVKVIVKS